MLSPLLRNYKRKQPLCRKYTKPLLTTFSDPKLSAILPKPAPETPQKPKLVLAQNNPHLKSHRRRQSAQVQSEQNWNSGSTMAGQHPIGMEHTKQLADVLYTRWTDGLRNRWPAV